MGKWSVHGLLFHYIHDVMKYALVAIEFDAFATVSGRCMAVHTYSLYATTHYKFQYICVCNTNATGKSLSLQLGCRE